MIASRSCSRGPSGPEPRTTDSFASIDSTLSHSGAGMPQRVRRSDAPSSRAASVTSVGMADSPTSSTTTAKPSVLQMETTMMQTSARLGPEECF